MPVLVDPKICVDREHCFAASACPYDAFLHNPLKKTWEVDAQLCGDCPGPCLNFCDKDALRWGDDLVDLSLVKAEIEGTMKHEQVVEARAKHKKELAVALEAARQKSADALVALTRANFEEEVLRSDLPVVVDCWADWCGPCKQFSPIFESLAKQYKGIVKFAKLDTEAEPTLARGLGIEALPTIMMFYKGQIANMVEGALPAEHFNAWIYQTLAAIRQYESQFEAEADEMVNSASRNVATLNGQGGAAPEPEPEPQSSGLFLDPKTDVPTDRPPDREPPGKQTASGLYIP
jgi:thioredoxin 2